MLTEEEEKKEKEKLLDELYKKERPEFKQWVCKQLGAVNEERKPGYKYPDGYIDEFNTCVMAQQSFNVGKIVFEKASLFLGNKEKYKHVIIIAFSFTGKIIELTSGDSDREIMLVTVKDLMKENVVSNIYREIKIADDPIKISKHLKIMK